MGEFLVERGFRDTGLPLRDRMRSRVEREEVIDSRPDRLIRRPL
jgi:hypothetical protein